MIDRQFPHERSIQNALSHPTVFGSAQSRKYRPEPDLRVDITRDTAVGVADRTREYRKPDAFVYMMDPWTLERLYFGETLVNSEKDNSTVDVELDARGFLCPLPVLKLRKRLSEMQAGQIIRITADDPAAVLDVPHFCAEQEHVILTKSVKSDLCVFVIEKS